MRTLQQIKSDFEQILSEVIRLNGISVESAVQVSTVILQEFGKYSRCPEAKTSGAETAGVSNGEDDEEPATFNQKKALKNLKIGFSDNIGKTEASKLIESAVSKFRDNGNGRVIPARSFPK
jgi:hypothetical protein